MQGLGEKQGKGPRGDRKRVETPGESAELTVARSKEKHKTGLVPGEYSISTWWGGAGIMAHL